MKRYRSRVAMGIALAYLFLTLIVSSPLIIAGAIHHGNGIFFLGALVLTFPLSWLLLWVTESLIKANAFYMSDVPYYLTLLMLCVSAVVNAFVIYRLVSFFHSKWLGNDNAHLDESSPV